MTREMTGTVVGFDGQYFQVSCPDAPGHLRLLNLVRGQMRGAVVGDAVRVGYQVTSRSGLWNVIAVVK